MSGVRIGLIVGYVGAVRQVRPAIITDVINAHDGIVGLTVFPGHGVYTFSGVPYDVDKQIGTWHWLDREN